MSSKEVRFEMAEKVSLVPPEEGTRGNLARASTEEVTKARELVTRLQHAIKDSDSVTLTKEEVEYLSLLFARGLMRAPEDIPSKLAKAGQQQSARTFANLYRKVRGENFFPVNVGFRNLSYTVKVSKGGNGIQTVGSSFKKLVTGLIKCVRRLQTKQDVDILKNVSGAFKAGTSTIVLGPPGSGVSTLFKVLCGQQKGGKVTGERVYSGHGFNDTKVRLMSDYIDQTDDHLPTMTVRETLGFAFLCSGGVGSEYFHDGATEEEKEEVIAMMKRFHEYLVETYGLGNCIDTIVGNHLLRGVSGGERRRVTVTEKIMLRRPLLFYDQASNGLDSKSVYDMCHRMASVSKILDLTIVAALLQPPVEAYELFDEVLVMMSGHIGYHGPQENVLPYFESIGYECPEDRDMADFIQEVASSTERNNYRTRGDAPRSDQELVAAWLSSPFSEAKRLQTEELCRTDVKLESPIYEKKYSLSAPWYALDFAKEFRIVFGRQFHLFIGDKKFIRARLLQSIVMGLVIGTVFYQMSPDIGPTNITAITQRYGLCFTVLLQAVLGNMALIPGLLNTRTVFYKQSTSYFFRTVSYVLAETLMAIPLNIVESIIFGTLTFWLSALVPTSSTDVIGQWFYFLFFIFSLNVTFGGFARCIAATAPTQGLAQTLAGVCVAFCVLFSGFIITPGNIPPYFIWIYWLVPVAWSIRMTMISIFTSDWAIETTYGEFALELFQSETSRVYIWSGIGVLYFYAILNFCWSIFAYSKVKYVGGGGSRSKVRSEEIDEENASRDSFSTSPASNVEAIESGNASVAIPRAVTIPRPDDVTLAANFTSASIIFKDVWYSVPSPTVNGETLDLLKGVSGYLLPGTMTALMGSSGAGKTTLMDVIAGRKTGGKITGDILVNGRPKDNVSFSRITGYVEQMDIHSPHSTVEEACMFSAFLRQDASVSKEDKVKFVKAVIDTLRLAEIRDSEIGITGEGGLSTEQAKRVTIGVEMAANPSIIFADEPTSGLDASGAKVIMKAISRVAKAGRTVVCTIHQPSQDIFRVFDNLLLLKRGGRVTYFGELGENSRKLIDYLEAIPGVPPMPRRHNPADYMLEVMGLESVDDLAHEYKASSLFTKNMQYIDDLIDRELRETEEVKFDSVFASKYKVQQEQLLLRWWRTYWRSPAYNFTRIMVNGFMGLLFGATFFDETPESMAKTQSFLGVIFLATVFLGVMSLNTTIPVLFTERAPYYREQAVNTYGSIPYVIAYTVAEIPYLLVSTLLFMSIVYFMIGFWARADKFFLFWFVFNLYVTIATFLGQFLASALPNQQTALLLAGVCSGLFSLFAGFTIAVFQVPSFWIFMTYLNPLRYAFAALVSIQMECNCTYDLLQSGTVLTCNNNQTCSEVCDTSAPGCTPIQEDGVTFSAWTYLEENWQFSDISVAGNIGALLLFVVVLRVATALSFAHVNHLKR